MEVLNLESFFQHFFAHRGLTLRTLEAFPEEHLSTHKVGTMRSFRELLEEMYQIEVYTMHGLLTKEWVWPQIAVPFGSKEEIKAAFAALNLKTKSEVPQISPERIQNSEKCLWMDGPNTWRLMYLVDNEIHHRAQGYVYLRQLGIEPPLFHER
jgi:uncharacterized damage-inducible protein DinB